MQVLCSNSALSWAPEKARVRHPLLILPPPPCWGPPRMHGLYNTFALCWGPEEAGMR